MKCSYCEKPVDISHDSGNYRKVTGWTKLRSRGANEIKRREDQDEAMHRLCMDRLLLGISPGQGSMFGEK